MLRKLTLLAAAAAAAAGCDDPMEPEGSQQYLIEAVTTMELPGGIAGVDVVTPVPVVRVVTTSGRPAAGVEVSFTVATGQVGAARVRSGRNGTASPGRWTLGPEAGIQVLVARVGGRSVSFSADAMAGAPTEVAIVDGDSQVGRTGSELGTPLRVRVLDRFGNGVPGIPVSFEVAEGGGTIAGDPVSSDEGGEAVSGLWTLGTDGPQSARASTGALSATFRACVDRDLASLTYFDGANVRQTETHACGTPSLLVQLPNPRALAWSPDGRRLAYEGRESFDSPGHYRVYLASLSDWKPQDRSGSAPSWSPDGQRLAVVLGNCATTCGVVAVYADGGGHSGEFLADAAASPAWSPDGTRISYIRTEPGTGAQTLYLVSADGLSEQVIMAGGGATFDRPTWSPDGSRIAFAKCEPLCRLWVVDDDGTNARALPLPDGDMRGPTWSPGGRHIAFSWNTGDIAYVAAEGGTPVVVGAGTLPAWRPTPGRAAAPPARRPLPPPPPPVPILIPADRDLAFVRGGQIHVARTDGSGVEQLTVADRGMADRQPRWSPDGRSLLFVRTAPIGWTTWVYLLGPGGIPERLAEGRDANWSPDGRAIVFVTGNDADSRVRVLDLATRAIRTIASGWWIYGPAWSPDGARILVTSDWHFYEGPLGLYSIRPDGGDRPIRLAMEYLGDFEGPAWSPDGGRIAAGYRAFPNEAELVVMNHDGYGLQRVALLGQAGGGTSPTPTWSPDGRTLIYTRFEPVAGERTLRSIRPDGSGDALLLADAWEADWRPVGTAAGRAPQRSRP